MSLLIPVEKPRNPLARHQALAPSAGIHVSPLRLGRMSIGHTGERAGLGMNKESSFKLLDAYYNMDGNFIDTANLYQEQSSEEFMGEWAEQRGRVTSSSFPPSLNYVQVDKSIKKKIHYTGNNAKAMHISVEASLKKVANLVSKKS